MNQYPRRVDGIEINEVADGFIVYQADKDRVHYLNNTAAVVIELCTGDISVTEMGEFLKDTFDLAEAPAKDVEECLANLFREGIVE